MTASLLRDIPGMGDLLARYEATAEAPRKRARAQEAAPVWPAIFPAPGERGYVNAESGHAYRPHNDEEAEALRDDGPRRLLCKGGEGSGKSAFGVVKSLDRLRRGCHGIMGSPDNPHFTRSLWLEFKNWCPWDQVVSQQRYLQDPDRLPHGTFQLNFVNGARLICGGFQDPSGWEGPNVNFAHFDEARRHRTAAMIKVLDGRVRIPGPHGESPQFWLTTTPKKHWLYTLFGPLAASLDEQLLDPYADFKRDSRVVTLLTQQNLMHLDPEYYRQRAQSLTEQERRVLLEAAWEDLEDAERFIESMIAWDTLREDLPAPTRSEPLVLAADAGVSGDSFGLVGVGRHPLFPSRAAVRLVREWVPPRGGSIDFDAVQKEIEVICKTVNVAQIAYDPYQLHQMMSNLAATGKAHTAPFQQGSARLIADKLLYDSIMARTLAHDGHAGLRRHIDNADKVVQGDERTSFRIVKREPSLKIDLAVCLSMALARLWDPKTFERKGAVSVPGGVKLGGRAVNAGLPPALRGGTRR